MGTLLSHAAFIAVVLAACARDGTTSPAPVPPAGRAAPEAVGQSELWGLVDASNSPAGPAASVEQLRRRLMKLPAEDIAKIDRQLDEQMARAHSWQVWGAAYVINGGCSNDCFDYFRAWLIMQGRAVFEATLRDPDSLAEHTQLTQPAELEDALSVARDAYRRVTGKELDLAFVKSPELGPGWDFDDPAEMKKRYPRLCQKFGCS